MRAQSSRRTTSGKFEDMRSPHFEHEKRIAQWRGRGSMAWYGLKGRLTLEGVLGALGGAVKARWPLDARWRIRGGLAA